MIAATFHGPNHFIPSHDEHTIEVFENIGHAISALFDRYDADGERPLPVRYLDGNHGDIPFRFVELGDSFECYRIDSLDGSTPPGDDATEDALTAVHIGLPDYVLTLMRPFNDSGAAYDGTVSVSVQKR
jgi:hypothetical protein